MQKIRENSIELNKRILIHQLGVIRKSKSGRYGIQTFRDRMIYQYYPQKYDPKHSSKVDHK